MVILIMQKPGAICQEEVVLTSCISTLNLWFQIGPFCLSLMHNTLSFYMGVQTFICANHKTKEKKSLALTKFHSTRLGGGPRKFAI